MCNTVKTLRLNARISVCNSTVLDKLGSAEMDMVIVIMPPNHVHSDIWMPEHLAPVNCTCKFNLAYPYVNYQIVHKAF